MAMIARSYPAVLTFFLLLAYSLSELGGWSIQSTARAGGAPSSAFDVVDVTSQTGKRIVGQVTRWQTQDPDSFVEHLAGTSPNGNVFEFFLPADAPGNMWQSINVSAQTGKKISSRMTSWQTSDGDSIVEHLAGRSPTGDLLVFFRSAGQPASDWQVVNVTAKTGHHVAGAVTNWQTPDGDFIVEHLAGRSPTGDLLVFFWSPRADWQVVNVSRDTGQKIALEVTNWQIQDGDFLVEHLAGRSPTGDLLVFYWSPAVPQGKWQAVDVSQITGQLIGGSVANWQTPDAEFIVEHLAGPSPTGDLLVFFWSPRADWQVVNVSQIAGGEPVTGVPAVYQVFDGLENVEILGVRHASGALRLYSWRPSHDWQINDPSEITALTLSSDPTGWLREVLDSIEENFAVSDLSTHLKVIRKPIPRPLLGPTQLAARYTSVPLGAGTLTWKDNDSDEELFFAEFSKDGTNWTQVLSLGANTTSADFHGLDINEGETAYFRVQTYRHGDYSPYSNVATATILPKPAAPSGLTCDSNLSRDGRTVDITLRWNDNATDESEYDVTRHEISPNPDFKYNKLPANSTTFTDVGLAPGTELEYFVFAYRASDDVFSETDIQCTAKNEFTTSMHLPRLTVSGGCAYTYFGSYPDALGQQNGRVTKISLSQSFLISFGLVGVNLGHGSVSCDNAQITLRSGGSLSGSDLEKLLGSNPRLPVILTAIASFDPPVPRDVPTYLTFDITYTAP